MERGKAVWIPGLVLLGAGLLGLLANFGLLGWLSSLAWAALFVAGGLLFLGWFGRDRAQWWALIPGSALVGLGLTILVNGAWGGAVFLGAIGLGFLGVYSSDRLRWWALIPGGVLVTLALVSVSGPAAGSTFFVGLALTFAIVYASEPRARHWAIYPAIACLVLATLSGAWLPSTWSVVWPLVLIVIGAYLLMPKGGIKH